MTGIDRLDLRASRTESYSSRSSWLPVQLSVMTGGHQVDGSPDGIQMTQFNKVVHVFWTAKRS